MKILKPLIIITAVFIYGCNSVPKSELQNLPSLVEIIAIDFNQSELNLRVSHRNNSTRKVNQLSCQLSIKGHEPTKFSQIPVPDLTTYAIETLTIDLSSSNLPEVDGKQKEIPYVLDCFLFSENFRKEHLIKKGTLFRVPGSQNEFR